MESRELTFPKDYIDSFTKLVEQVNKKARKFGTAEATLEVINEFEESVYFESVDYKALVEFVTVRISNLETPVYAGYEFIGKISNVDGITQIQQAGGEKIPSEFTNDPEWNRCDHCNTKHQRKHLFVVKDVDTNEKIQVGRACVKDFTGHPDAAQAVENILRFLAELDNYSDVSEDELVSFAKASAPLKDVLMASIKEIDEAGFVPRSASFELPTADAVHSQIFGKGKPTEYSDKASAADSVIEWVHNEIDPKEDKNDWEYNVSQIFQREQITTKHLGIVASVYSAYKKAQERKNKIQTVSEWVGEVKERKDFTFKITFHTVSEGYYGLTHIYKFIDSEGHEFIWFGSKEIDAIEGEWVNVKATIKKHDEYNGTKQTHLTRVKLQENLGE